MKNLKTSFRRARAISSALFLFSLALMTYAQDYWPHILLAIGIPMAVRHYLLARYQDMCASLLIFGGFYSIAQFDLEWEVLLPVIFVIVAAYILLREFTPKQKVQG